MVDLPWEDIPDIIATEIESITKLKRDKQLLGDKDSVSAAPISDAGFRLDPISVERTRGFGRQGERCTFTHAMVLLVSHDLSGAPDRRATAALATGRKVMTGLPYAASLLVQGFDIVDCMDGDRSRENGRLLQEFELTLSTTLVIGGALGADEVA